MRCIWTLLLISVICCQAQSIDPVDIQKAVELEALSHPYLLFDEQGKTDILFRIESDPESRNIMNRLLAEADKLLYEPIDSNIPLRPTHVRAGWTELDRENAYGRKLRKYRTYAQKLAFVYQMTGEEVYAQKAYAFAEVVCRMPLWTLQAHEFDIIYSRVWPWNVEDDQVNFNFDIGSATTGQVIAWVYDWTYPALQKAQRDRLRGALLEKVITPVRGAYEFHWWADAYRCNWTGVCNAGVGMAALALLGEHPQLGDVVAESYNRIHRMMDQIGQDGGWQEGGSYWRYGMDRSALFAFALKRATQGSYNLFQHEKVRDNPVAFPLYLFVPPDRSVNFGDAHDHYIRGTDFFNLLTTETQNAEGAWYRQEILGEGRDMLNLIFPRPTISPEAPTDFSRHFRDIDWWVMRSSFTDPNRVTVAGKAGKNDDPHHGHLDIGHFILFWKGQAYLKDSGRPYYDEEYFDEARWDYPQGSSEGHNVLIINGEGQMPGKLKDQPFDYEIGGEVISFRTQPERDYVLMDPTKAYPGKELASWRRHIFLEKPNLTLAFDEVKTTSASSKIQLRYHSEVAASPREDWVLLEGEEGMMALIPLGTEAMKIENGKHAYQPVHATKAFEWLPYFDICSLSETHQAEVFTLIVPVADIAEARSIRASMDLQKGKNTLGLALKYRKKKYTFSFERSAAGKWERKEEP